jgi:adenine phosphoribosyltransferase
MTHFMNHLFTKTLPQNGNKVDVIVGLDARGFLLGPLIAARLGAAFVPVRKRGKLPGQCHVASYEKEYGVVSKAAEVPSLYIVTEKSLRIALYGTLG